MDLKKIVRESVRNSLDKSGKLPKKEKPAQNKKAAPEKLQEGRKSPAPKVMLEAQFVTPQSFILRTEKLSEPTKRAHERLYNSYVDKFNKASSALDGANKEEANANNSEYRSLKIDEVYNLNAIKLHELYFHNISDMASEISVDAVSYMRLSRDFGNFQNWQFDFMAACRAAREGWAMVVYEPYKDVFMNVVVDSHDVHVPVGTVPVLVMDMWAHSYYRDYEDNKDDYVVAMMREINWDVVEARMILAERCELNGLYMIRPIYNAAPTQMLDKAQNPPIDQVHAPGRIETPDDRQQVSPSTPQAPAPSYPLSREPSGGL